MTSKSHAPLLVLMHKFVTTSVSVCIICDSLNNILKYVLLSLIFLCSHYASNVTNIVLYHYSL